MDVMVAAMKVDKSREGREWDSMSHLDKYSHLNRRKIKTNQKKN